MLRSNLGLEFYFGQLCYFNGFFKSLFGNADVDAETRVYISNNKLQVFNMTLDGFITLVPLVLWASLNFIVWREGRNLKWP